MAFQTWSDICCFSYSIFAYPPSTSVSPFIHFALSTAHRLCLLFLIPSLLTHPNNQLLGIIYYYINTVSLLLLLHSIRSCSHGIPLQHQLIICGFIHMLSCCYLYALLLLIRSSAASPISTPSKNC